MHKNIYNNLAYTFITILGSVGALAITLLNYSSAVTVALYEKDSNITVAQSTSMAGSCGFIENVAPGLAITTVYNKSANSVLITYTRPKSQFEIEQTSNQDCIFTLHELKPEETVSTEWDAEAIWVWCSNSEPGCEENRRPFKLGGCTDDCFILVSSANNKRVVYLKGTTRCQKQCGWIGRGKDGWPDAWATPQGIPSVPAVPDEDDISKLNYILDLSEWSCEQLILFFLGKCYNQRPKATTVVNTSVLNVRAGPGENFSRTTTLQKGAPVSVEGKNSDECKWLKITADTNIAGWVAAQYISGNPCSNTLVIAFTPPPTATPLPTSTPETVSQTDALGLIDDFEQWKAWQRSNEEWGTFTQSSERGYGSRFSGKFEYNFPTSAGNKNFLIYRRSILLTTKPTILRVQVFGNSSGNYLNAWIQDAIGNIWQFTFGQVKHTGWHWMEAPLDPNLSWPNQLISGTSSDKKLVYPLKFYALVVDGVPDGVAQQGVIYIDDLRAFDSAILPTPTPTNLPSRVTPTTTKPAPEVTFTPTSQDASTTNFASDGEVCGQFIRLNQSEEKWPAFQPYRTNEIWIIAPTDFTNFDATFQEGIYVSIKKPDLGSDLEPAWGYARVRYLTDSVNDTPVSNCDSISGNSLDLPQLKQDVLSQLDDASVSTDYPQQAEQLVNTLFVHLGDFGQNGGNVSQDAIQQALQGEEVSLRLNATVQGVWGTWVERGQREGFDPTSTDPGLFPDLSPFRRLIIRLIQGNQVSLSAAEQHAFYSLLTRSEDLETWSNDMNAIVGAINRENFPNEQPAPTPTPIPPPQPPVASVALEMVTIPAGNFTMGSSNADIQSVVSECNGVEGNCQEAWFGSEKPARTVFVDIFNISKYEVTNTQYNACVNAGICGVAGRSITDDNITYNPGFFADNLPVVGVSWQDASTFCNWLSGRLPTEVEWEKAARGSGDQRRYPWGSDYDPSRANLSSGYPTAVGRYPGGASPYGIMDMAGNVFEWTATADGDKYILRSGGWNNYYYRGRVTDRGTKLPPGFANYDIGFRCASR